MNPLIDENFSPLRLRVKDGTATALIIYTDFKKAEYGS